MNITRVLKQAACYFCVFAISVSLLGCSSMRRALNYETAAKLYFTVDEEINPDTNGRPSPLVLRVYELKDRRQFENEDFLSLYGHDEERLGNDLFSKRVLREFTPGDNRLEQLTISSDAQYLGVIGEFVHYERANFRVIVPVKPYYTLSHHVLINKQGLRISADLPRERYSSAYQKD